VQREQLWLKRESGKLCRTLAKAQRFPLPFSASVGESHEHTTAAVIQSCPRP